eukprot:IDg17027t1
MLVVMSPNTDSAASAISGHAERRGVGSHAAQCARLCDGCGVRVHGRRWRVLVHAMGASCAVMRLVWRARSCEDGAACAVMLWARHARSCRAARCVRGIC